MWFGDKKMKEIRLERKINGKCYKILATINIATKIDYIPPILQHIKENGKNTDARSLSKKLLLDVQISTRLLDICVDYGLLKKDNKKYIITDEGENTLVSKITFIPEFGLWQICYTDDPLIPDKYKILSLIRETNPVTEKEGNNKKFQTTQEPEELPPPIKKLESKRIIQSFSNILKNKSKKSHMNNISREFNIASFEENATKISNIPVKLIWTINNTNSKLELFVENNSVDIPFLPNIDYESIWKLLLDEHVNYWDKQHECLLVHFDQINESERNTMKKIIRCNPNIKKYKKFDPLNISVDIYPENHNDARQWADWLLKKKIIKYATQELYNDWKTDIEKKFKSFNLKLGARSYYIPNDLDKNTSLFWNLQGPEDWNI